MQRLWFLSSKKATEVRMAELYGKLGGALEFETGTFDDELAREVGYANVVSLKAALYRFAAGRPFLYPDPPQYIFRVGRGRFRWNERLLERILPQKPSDETSAETEELEESNTHRETPLPGEMFVRKAPRICKTSECRGTGYGRFGLCSSCNRRIGFRRGMVPRGTKYEEGDFFLMSCYDKECGVLVDIDGVCLIHGVQPRQVPRRSRKDPAEVLNGGWLREAGVTVRATFGSPDWNNIKVVDY